MAGRPATTALRETWRANVDLPRPWGPAIRLSEPARRPPPMASSRTPKPVGQNVASGSSDRRRRSVRSRTSMRGVNFGSMVGLKRGPGPIMTRLVGNDPKG